MPPKPQAKPGDKKAGGAQQLIDDDYSDLPALPSLNNFVFTTVPIFKYKKNLSDLNSQLLKHFLFAPEDPISQKVKVIQREDIVNYAKLKQYITEEEAVDMVDKLGQEKTNEIMAKTTNDMLMSYEVQAKRLKKDQPPSDHTDVELTVWLKDFPQTSSDFKLFYAQQHKLNIHTVFLIEEKFMSENEDEELLQFSSSDPQMDRYYQEEERKRIEEKRKVEFLSEERIATFHNALEIGKMFASAHSDSEMKLCTVNKLKFQGPDCSNLQQESVQEPGSNSDNIEIDPKFVSFAQSFKLQVDECGADLYEYKLLRKEYLALALTDKAPKPLMPYPDDILKKQREEEEKEREQQIKIEQERKAQELLIQQQQEAAKKKGPAGKQAAAQNTKSRENLKSSLSNQRPESQIGSRPPQDEILKKKPMVKSKDDEDKEWNFHQLEKVLSELPSANGTVGNILAAMVYQLSHSKPPSHALTDADKQFILKTDEQENDINGYFDDIFNKLAIEHNIMETSFQHQVQQNPGSNNGGSPYQSLFNENDRVSKVAKTYKFLSGDPISMCENSTLQNSQLPGINNRNGMPQQPAIAQPQRESDLAAILSFSSLPSQQSKRALLLHACEKMFKQPSVHPERDFFFLDRNYVEKFDSTTLRQVLAHAMRYGPDIVHQYDTNEDALLLGIYHKNPPGRLLRRQVTYPLKVFPDYNIWLNFIKHDTLNNTTLDINNLYDVDPSKVGLLRTNSKFYYPSDNSLIRVDKHIVGNRRLGSSMVVKDNLVFGVKESSEKFKGKKGLFEDEVLSREALAQTDRKCVFWLEYENGVKVLVEMAENQIPNLEEVPLQEPLPPHIEEEVKKMNESSTLMQHGGDIEDNAPKVQIESLPVGQPKTGMKKNESQKSIKGTNSQLKQSTPKNKNAQQQQQQLQKNDSAKSLESNVSQPTGPSKQELALLQKKKDEEHRLMSATSKKQFFQDRYDPTSGSKITFTFQEGLIVQIMPNGDVSQSLVENPQAKKKYGGTLHQDSLPAYLQEKSRLITRNGQVIRYFLDGNMQIFYPDGAITTTDKRKGVWYTVSVKGIKRVRKLLENQVYDEPKKLKITEKLDPETSATVQVREDGVLVIKYIDESRLVMLPDGTHILTKKNTETGSGTITIITKEGFAPVRQIYDPVKARAKTVIGLGGADSMMGIENIMERTNNGKITEVLLPDKTIVQSYQERQELEGYNHFMTNMVHLIKRDDFSIIKVRQDGEVVIISSNERAYLNSIGKQKDFGVNDYDHFFELFGIPNERRSGVYTVNLDLGRMLTQDEEGNVFIVYANGDSVEKLSVSFNLDQMVEGIEKKEPESPRIKNGEYIEEECKFLPPPKTIAQPRLFLIKNDVGYEFFNEQQLEYLFRCVDKDKELIVSRKPVKIDNEDAVSHLFLRKQKPFDPNSSFSNLTQPPKIPQSVELVNQTVSIPTDPVSEEYLWRNITEYKKMDSPQQVEEFKNMIQRYQNLRQRQTEERERLKVVEIKSDEHKEHECKIWLRIAKERNIDVTKLVGEEYKPLKDVVKEDKKQKFLDDLDNQPFDDDHDDHNIAQ